MTFVNTANWPKQEELAAYREAGATWQNLADMLKCSIHAVRRYARDGHLPILFENAAAASEDILDDTVRSQDKAFVASMTAAIAAGRERATFGIFVDDRPMPVMRIFVPLTWSGCGSAAAACAEISGAAVE